MLTRFVLVFLSVYCSWMVYQVHIISYPLNFSLFVIFFLFFKLKTAYEMRIIDWSSDVCSSDLPDFFALKIMRSRDTMNRTFKRRMGQLLQAMFKRDFPGDIEGRAHQPRTKLIRGLARHTDSSCCIGDGCGPRQ